METILLTIVIFTGIIVVTYIILYNNIQAFNIKINEAESIIDDLLRKKYDNLDNMKSIILKETDLPEQTFEVFEKVKNVNISSFDLDRKLTEAYNIILEVKNDHEELNTKEFNKDLKEIDKINETLTSCKTYFNNNTSELNKLIRKVPTNIVAKIHGYKIKPFFDGKNMQDAVIDDFKL